MKRSVTTLVLLAIVALAPNALAADHPNILFIMSDDHAAHAIGAYGGRLAPLDPTPNIDRLAEEGIRLTNAFCTNSICTPARATLLTGQYCHVNGVTTLNGRVKPEDQALAHLVKQAGYQTAMVGKWHVKEEPAFDYYCVLPGQGSYFNPVMRDSTQGEWPDNERRFAGYDCTHSSDAIVKTSLNWLKKRNKNKPFFLMHHFKSPHDNFENAERYDWLYQDVEIPEPESLWRVPNYGSDATKDTGTSISRRNERRNMGHHMFVDQDLEDEEYTRTAYQRYLKKYLRTVRGVDDGIGQLVDYLKETGQLDNTVILYTSDQGFMLGEHDYIDKRWMYDESLRVPFIVRYPKLIKPGSVCDAIVNNVDFAPTLLELAGTKATAAMQGRSLVPLLEGHVPTDWPTSTYYRYWMHMAHHDNPAHYGVRTKDYKLIFFYGLKLDAPGAKAPPTQPGWELYDLRKDPHEMNNVYDDPAYAQVVKDMKAELLRLKKETGDSDEKYPELMEVRREYW
jgi:arylsulfatase A-like enzyme